VALPALTAALQGPSPDVVLAAIESLDDFDDTSVAEPCASWRTTRNHACGQQRAR
jgi:hypothetical protein